MKSKSVMVFLGTLTLAALACGCGALQPAPVSPSLPADGSQATPALTMPSPNATLLPAASPSSAAGLSVAYLSGGNLWIWDAAGARQLMAGGDVSGAVVSKGGGAVAFLRGREVWTMRADGSGEQMLATQPGEGSALCFAPNGSLLAVSSPDHIDVLDLSTGGSVTVLAYPAVPGFNPQVAWAPDSSGFKTVIPTGTEGGPAQLHYIFPDGTVANLGSLDLAPLSESQPLLSPDGGYVIYTAKLDGDQRSLYLMDASGATRPYGEPAARVRALGWQPDSKHFAYFSEGTQTSTLFTGSVGGQPLAGAPFDPFLGRWVDAQRYLLLENGNLYLGDLSGGQLLLAGAVESYAFSTP